MNSEPSSGQIEPLRKPVKCPSCSNTSKRELYPFCSKRCSDVDLHHWFTNSYTISSREVTEDQDEEFSNA